MSKLLLLLRLVAAGILLQTLFFKFTGAEESVFIFSQLGVEPWGRVFSGIVELFAAGLLLYQPTAAIGAIVASNVMIGAVLSHIFFLGIEVQADGGLLFGLACTVLMSSLVIVVLLKKDLICWFQFVKGKLVQ
jgi:DoxX-like family